MGDLPMRLHIQIAVDKAVTFGAAKTIPDTLSDIFLGKFPKFCEINRNIITIL
jgi:hypothetical protein